MPRTNLPSLTPLRGIAALVVLFHHLTAFYLPQTGEVIAEHSQLLINGYLCVDFFFILSGFLLAHLYRDKLYGPDRIKVYGGFIQARFARIYPLHLVALLAMLGLNLAFVAAEIQATSLDAYLASDNFQALRTTGQNNAVSFTQHLFLVHSLQDNYYASWNSPAWSIGAEWIAYLLFPLLLLPSRIAPRLNKLLCIPLALLGLFLIEQWNAGSLNHTGFAGTGRCLLECWLGITFHSFFRSKHLQSLLAKDSSLLLAIATSILVLQWDLLDTLVILPFAVVILCASQNYGTMNRILNGKALTFLGEVSYSVYMLHWFFFSSVRWLWKGAVGTEFGSEFGIRMAFAVLISSTIAILALAWITYRFIELPWRSKLRAKRAGDPHRNPGTQ